MTATAASRRLEQNCHAWGSTDTIRCPAKLAESREKRDEKYDPESRITIKRAREDYHSFGGEIPLDLHEGLEIASRETVYPPEAYKRYDNRVLCDSCGHKCLNG